MEAYISGLERFVGWVEKYHPSHYTVKSIRNKAQSLLAEEKSAPIHADWKLREELGEYMDELKQGDDMDKDYADDLEKILAKCPVVYFMGDNPAISKPINIDKLGALFTWIDSVDVVNKTLLKHKLIGILATPIKEGQEPLAESLYKLANRKGLEVWDMPARIDGKNYLHYLVRKQIGKDSFESVIYEAESKARAYLSSLPDQNKGDK